MECRVCGKRLEGGGEQRYCPFCGAELAGAAPGTAAVPVDRKAAPDASVCTHSFQRMPEGPLRCRKCGAVLHTESAATGREELKSRGAEPKRSYGRKALAFGLASWGALLATYPVIQIVYALLDIDISSPSAPGPGYGIMGLFALSGFLFAISAISLSITSFARAKEDAREKESRASAIAGLVISSPLMLGLVLLGLYLLEVF